MAVLKVVIWPDLALTKVADEVTRFDTSLQEFVRDLFDTMYKANGVGLAATQVAVNQRVLVIDLDPNGDAAEDTDIEAELESWGYEGPVALINPTFIKQDGEISWEEGCLSVPGITAPINRFEHIIIRAQKPNGEFFELAASGLFSVAIQHEIDHLDGKVFVEYLSKLKRDLFKKKMIKLKETEDDGVVAAANL